MNKFSMKAESVYSGYLIRLFMDWSEIAYLKFELSGPQIEIEFPSDWHEEKRGWVRLGFVLFKFCFTFPWYKTVPDDCQCSGPTYGFHFFEDGLHIHWGKSHGKQEDPFTIIGMPWRWKHRQHNILGKPETHPYRYVLKSGEVQNRIATIQKENRKWTRFWIPWRKISTSININFDDEVGEESGTWKGGCLGCGYEIAQSEEILDTLMRMERDRKF